MDAESQPLIDPITLTPLSLRGYEDEYQEEVIPLSEYKFFCRRLVVVKRTAKHKRNLIGGIEKDVIECFEESKLWDVLGPYMARVGEETLVVIAEMALGGQSSSEAMAKENALLKESSTQDQNELSKNMKNATKDKKISLDKLRIALEVRHEQEKQELVELHTQELGELQEKIESTMQEKKETKALNVIGDQSLITNSHLREIQ